MVCNPNMCSEDQAEKNIAYCRTKHPMSNSIKGHQLNLGSF